jgi:MurNAc alpha-1-phosphate uridylyltransferase
MAERPQQRVAHLVLVENPPWHAEGDMGLAGGLVTRARPWLTFASIGVFHPGIFREIAPGAKQRLFPWVYRFADQGRVTGEIYRGPWDNVGTAEQLARLDRRLSA